MAASPKRRYRVEFYDLMPAAPHRQLSPFPGSFRRNDFTPSRRVKLVHESLIDGIDPTETLFTVTQQPSGDATDGLMVEVVFDSHMAAQHRGRPRNHYSTCCFESVRLADLGAAPYPDGSWNQLNYCAAVYEAE